MISDLFYLGGIVREMRGAALIINGTSDHVHMLVRIRPAQSAAEVARVVKANSSRWVRGKWKTDFAWQAGYGVFSVSESNVPAVFRYHCKPGAASPEAFISTRIGGLPQEEPDSVRRAVHLGLDCVLSPRTGKPQRGERIAC